MSWLRPSQPLSDGPVVQDGPAAGPGLCPCIMHQQLRQSFCVWEPGGMGACPLQSPVYQALHAQRVGWWACCVQEMGSAVGPLSGERGEASWTPRPAFLAEAGSMAHCKFRAVSQGNGPPSHHLPGLPDLLRTHCLVINRGSLANPGSSQPVIPWGTCGVA